MNSWTHESINTDIVTILTVSWTKVLVLIFNVQKIKTFFSKKINLIYG